MINVPVVSVIVPTYNYEAYISAAIESIFLQDYPADRIEIIVVDDGSTDNTRGLLEPWFLSGKIQYLYQTNKGKASATKLAIQRSRGKYIFNLDADDYFFPGKIKDYVSIFETDMQIVHVASPARILFVPTSGRQPETESIPDDLTGKVLDGNDILKNFYRNNIMFGGGTTYAARADYLKQINIPNEVDMYIDEFLILAVLPLGKSYFFQNPYSVWRVHSRNFSVGKANEEEQLRKAKRLLSSSAAVLKYIIENNYDRELVKIYKLRHATRTIVSKETQEFKQMNDIFEYAAEVFIGIKPGWKLIRKYNVFNRFLPLSLLNIFRIMKNRKWFAP